MKRRPSVESWGRGEAVKEVLKEERVSLYSAKLRKKTKKSRKKKFVDDIKCTQPKKLIGHVHKAAHGLDVHFRYLERKERYTETQSKFLVSVNCNKNE